MDLAVSSRHSAQPIAGWVLQQSRVIAAQAAASSQWPYRLAWLAAVLSSLDAPRNSSRPYSDWRESEQVRPITVLPQLLHSPAGAGVLPPRFHGDSRAFGKKKKLIPASPSAQAVQGPSRVSASR